MDGRVNFVSGISSDHVLDGLVAARVVLHPGVDLEDMLVQDDDGPAVCYELLDVVGIHDRVLPGGGPKLGRVHGWRRVDVGPIRDGGPGQEAGVWCWTRPAG